MRALADLWRAALADLWRAALAACDPRALVRDFVLADPLGAGPVPGAPVAADPLGAGPVPGAADPLLVSPSEPRSGASRGDAHPPPITLISVGKSAPAMAAGALDVLGPRITRRLVIAPDGTPDLALDVTRAAHPIPDARSESAGRAMLALAATTPADHLLLVLVSGGASALAAVPRRGLTLAEKSARIQALARTGAPIAALNALRTSLSAIKGGQLAAGSPAPVVTLVLSDVPGDDLAIVGSGPTLPLRPGDRATLVAGLASFRAAAATAARAAGFTAVVEFPALLTGTTAATAATVLDATRTLPPGGLWVAGGEWTLALPADPGTGGRATHLALTLAVELAGDLTVLVVSSDGVDGTGPAAGALVDATTAPRLAAAGISIDDALARCDSGAALAAIGATLPGAPTGCNHADLILVVRNLPTRVTQDPT